MPTPTPEQIEKIAHVLNKLNLPAQQYGVGDLIAALFQRVSELEADVKALQTP